MAEPRFNNPYFWPPPPSMPGQLDNLVLINKIKEQLMQTLLVPTSSPDGSAQHSMPVLKPQQLSGHHIQQQGSGQPDIALHARPASSSGQGLAPSSRPESHGTSEALTPTTPTSSSHNRLGGTPSVNIISGLAGLLGPPPKAPRGRKKIKAENSSGPLLVVPYPILADQGCVTIAPKEGKTYRLCKVCPLTFLTKSEMQIHSKSHTEAKAHKCPHCSKTFANASYLSQHLRIHLGIKPYHCSYCENSFRQLSHLQQHTRIHTGDRPYKCAHPGCEKAFTQLSNLQSHQRQHNKDKPYKCPNCYRAYSDSASLQIHLSAHAIKNAKAYCCSMCGRAYTSETYLMKHMSKHTVVEHLVSHQSPQRTESPSIPIRISLI
uniref:Zinc finger protein 362b n=1 Tax=Labrus bergylta TaxID=56723 RepID=A0A3Q3NAC1_9LABR